MASNWTDITDEAKSARGGRTRTEFGVRKTGTGATYVLFPEGKLTDPYAKIFYDEENERLGFEGTETKTSASVRPLYKNAKGVSSVMQVHVPKRYQDRFPKGTFDIKMKKMGNKYVLELKDLDNLSAKLNGEEM